MNIEKKRQYALLSLVFFIALFLACLWLGGYLFFKINHIHFPNHLFSLIEAFQATKGAIWQKASYKAIVIACVAIPIIFSFIFFFTVANMPKRELHGSARFARFKEIETLGLFKEKSEKERDNDSTDEVLIGKFNGKYLRWNSDKFIFVGAPTRSGKGVGLVIPNCLNYRHSMVIYDPKLENFNLTSGYRHEVLGQKVFLFNPSGKENNEGKMISHCWNPLSYIPRDGIRTVKYVQNIANILYSSGKGGEENGNAKFFNEMAQKLFLGIVLYMVEHEKRVKAKLDEALKNGMAETDPDMIKALRNELAQAKPTMALLQSLTTPKGKSFASWIKNDVAKDEYYSSICTENLLSYATTSDQTAASILSSLVAPLGIFSDPVVQRITSSDDFDLRNLRKEKMTIYIGVSPDDSPRFSRLINLFFSQLISLNTQQLPSENPALKYQCLLLIDEFADLGKVDIIEKAVAYIAGYGLRLFTIFQNMAQINRNYTKDGARSLSTNFDCQIIYTPRDNEDAKEFSEIIGYETFKSKGSSKNHGKLFGSISISDQKRAVMMPEELRQMPPSDCIISMAGTLPIMAKKIIYYKDPIFLARLGYPVAPIPEINMDKTPIEDVKEPSENATASSEIRPIEAYAKQTIFEGAGLLDQPEEFKTLSAMLEKKGNEKSKSAPFYKDIAKTVS